MTGIERLLATTISCRDCSSPLLFLHGLLSTSITNSSGTSHVEC